MNRCPAVLYLVAVGPDPRIFEPLCRQYPEAKLTDSGLEVPLIRVGPEEILADCCSARVAVRASVVRVSASPASPG